MLALMDGGAVSMPSASAWGSRARSSSAAREKEKDGERTSRCSSLRRALGSAGTAAPSLALLPLRSLSASLARLRRDPMMALLRAESACSNSLRSERCCCAFRSRSSARVAETETRAGGGDMVDARPRRERCQDRARRDRARQDRKATGPHPNRARGKRARNGCQRPLAVKPRRGRPGEASRR